VLTEGKCQTDASTGRRGDRAAMRGEKKAVVILPDSRQASVQQPRTSVRSTGTELRNRSSTGQ
jgi:hypothetical protein